MALDWGAHRPRRYVLCKCILDVLRFGPEARIRSRILRAIFRPLTLSKSEHRNTAQCASCFFMILRREVRYDAWTVAVAETSGGELIDAYCAPGSPTETRTRHAPILLWPCASGRADKHSAQHGARANSRPCR